MVIIQSTYRWLQSIIKNELMATKPFNESECENVEMSLSYNNLCDDNYTPNELLPY